MSVVAHSVSSMAAIIHAVCSLQPRITQFGGEKRKLAMSSGGYLRIQNLSPICATGESRLLANFGCLKQQSVGLRGSFFRDFRVLQQRRLCGVGVQGARAKLEDNKKRGGSSKVEKPLLDDDTAQLAVSLPLGLASFEGLYLVGWLASLRGLLPRGYFAAADLLLCGLMFANCAFGWYALEHSRSEIEEAKPANKKVKSKLKAVGPGLFEMVFSLVFSFIPFANTFLWFRFTSKQKHLPAKAKAAILANAFIYEGPRFFALLLLFSGGLRVFLQVGLVSNLALVFGALHRPFEESRIKNEKVLLEVSRSKKIGGKKEEKPKEISAEERERIARLKELEEFDMLLAQRPGRSDSISSFQSKLHFPHQVMFVLTF